MILVVHKGSIAILYFVFPGFIDWRWNELLVLRSVVSGEVDRVICGNGLHSDADFLLRLADCFGDYGVSWRK